MEPTVAIAIPAAAYDAATPEAPQQQPPASDEATLAEAVYQLQGEVRQLEAVVAEKKREAEDAQSRSQAAAAQAACSEAEHKSAEKAAGAWAKMWAEQRKDLDRAASVFKGSFETLRSGGQDAATPADVEAVCGSLRDAGAEAPLVAATPGAVASRPELRKPFDEITLESVAEVLSEQFRKAESVVAASQPEERQSKAELLGLWAIMDVDSEASQAAEQAVSTSRSDSMVAQKGLTAARKRLREAEAALEESRAAKLQRQAAQLREESEAAASAAAAQQHENDAQTKQDAEDKPDDGAQAETQDDGEQQADAAVEPEQRSLASPHAQPAADKVATAPIAEVGVPSQRPSVAGA